MVCPPLVSIMNTAVFLELPTYSVYGLQQERNRPLEERAKSKNSKRIGLEGHLGIHSLAQHHHFRDVEAKAPRILVADLY